MVGCDIVVSVVSHSKRELVLECLRSLKADAHGEYDVEVVVLDNASDDGSAEAARLQYPNVTVVAQDHRAGFGANHNVVIRETDSTYVFLLNDDSTVTSGCVAALARYMDAHPRVGAVGPRVVGMDGHVQQTAWRLPTVWAAFSFALTLGQRDWVQSRGEVARQVGWVSGCALMLRRRALERIGLFDEGFFMYSEDTDLGRRLAANGYESHYVPTATVVHRSQQSSAGLPDRRMNEHWRSVRRYWTKHHSSAGARMALAGLGLGLALKGLITISMRVMPRPLRPERARGWRSERFLDQARRCWFGETGPGLRELAEDWNRTRGSK